MKTKTKTPRKMKLDEVKAKAEKMGIKPGKLKKADLIQAIQKAENNPVCYGTSNGTCERSECCFYADCVKSGSR